MIRMEILSSLDKMGVRRRDEENRDQDDDHVKDDDQVRDQPSDDETG